MPSALSHAAPALALAVAFHRRGAPRRLWLAAWNGARHRVSIEYDGQPGDQLEWRLYSPAEFREVCASVGLATVLTCAWCDEATPVAAQHARMQFVLERHG